MDVAQRFWPGDLVLIRETADNFGGRIGQVVKVGRATCEVKVGQFTGTFLFQDLELWSPALP